jgi:hypothetical protein
VFLGAVPIGQPRGDDPVEVVSVQTPQQSGDGVGAGHVAVLEPQRVTEPLLAESAELGDRFGTGVAGQDRHQTEGQQPDQRVLTPAPVAGIGQFGQTFDQRASLERQLNGTAPNTLQDILEEALEPWLRSNGYQR